MTKTLHVNTPEQTISGVDIDDIDDDDDDDDGSFEKKLSNKQELIEQLQAQLIHNQMRRIQPRDYSRILSESNTPAYWYKAPQKNRSVYFYDPKYQKYAQQQSNSPQRIKPNIQVNNKLYFSIDYNSFTSYFSQSLLHYYEVTNVLLIIQILFKTILFHLHLVQNIC